MLALLCPTLLIAMPYMVLASGAETDRWIIQQQRGAIELYAEFDPDVPRVWSEVEDVRRELAEQLNVRASGEKIQIMLFASHGSYLRYLQADIPDARYRRAIFFRNGDVYQIYVWRSRSLITDLRHELTHALLHQHLMFLPLWIDEGLAEYFEEPAARRLQSARLGAVRWKARVGWTPSLNQLEAIPAAAEMTEDDYRDSWAWVCFLMQESPETRQLLADYLQVIARGEAPGAFSHFLQVRAPGTKNRLNSYFRKFQIPLSSAQD